MQELSQDRGRCRSSASSSGEPRSSSEIEFSVTITDAPAEEEAVGRSCVGGGVSEGNDEGGAPALDGDRALHQALSAPGAFCVEGAAAKNAQAQFAEQTGRTRGNPDFTAAHPSSAKPASLDLPVIDRETQDVEFMFDAGDFQEVGLGVAAEEAPFTPPTSGASP